MNTNASTRRDFSRLATVLACQAGKHVYVERPASHNICEGRKMIEAGRRYKVRMQVGLNNRSSPNVREAIPSLHDGGNYGFRQDEGPSTSASCSGHASRANFVDALRSGKDETLHSDIHEGHLSTSLCHLANISYRVGRSLTFTGAGERFASDGEADALLTRAYRAPYVAPDNV